MHVVTLVKARPSARRTRYTTGAEESRDGEYHNAPEYFNVETGGTKRVIIIASGTQTNRSEDMVLNGYFGTKLKPLINTF